MRATRRPQATHEHEFEPQYGLPERLPEGERILWQGAPDWRVLARRAFHFNTIALYFAVLLAWRVGTLTSEGMDLAGAVRSLTVLAPLFGTGLALVAVMAWLSARTTAYTLTDRRIVMRIGIVLTVSYNVPLRRIESADLRGLSRGHGDIALLLEPQTRIAWLQLWPHVRPWRLARAQPMLRALPDAARVARLVADAWAEANGTAPTAAAMPAAGANSRQAAIGERPALAAR
jgi:hypothetical protein